MPQRRDTTTDSLSNVIQVIQLGRKTGVLSVERGEGKTYEEGTITFVNGQVTHANAGLRSNVEAFYWLNAWGPCRFTFTFQATRGTPLPVQTQPTQPLPPFTPNQMNSPTAPMNAVRPSLETNEAKQSYAEVQERIPAHGMEALHGTGRQPVAHTTPIRSIALADAFRVVEQRGLSRSHRRLLLLVDGQRALPELVRLMGRRPDEVTVMLQELERIGVIQLS